MMERDCGAGSDVKLRRETHLLLLLFRWISPACRRVRRLDLWRYARQHRRSLRQHGYSDGGEGGQQLGQLCSHVGVARGGGGGA